MAEKCTSRAAAENGAILSVANGSGFSVGSVFVFVASFLQISGAQRGVAKGVAGFDVGRAGHSFETVGIKRVEVHEGRKRRFVGGESFWLPITGPQLCG